MSVLVVTGTGTGVGKTVTTAAVAALALDRGPLTAGEPGGSVAVVKPAQTGVAPGEPGDADLVRELTGLTDVHELARYPDPLAPATAARLRGLPAVDLAGVADTVAKLSTEHRLVLVEGAGGLLVRYDEDGRTLADLAQVLKAPVLVVTRPALGTLSDTALTLEALERRGLELAGVVIGSWPRRPELAERANLADLERVAGRPLAGALPEGSGLLDQAAFRTLARRSLASSLGGTFDPAAFRGDHLP
ncbi:dethiobiotin synthase [Pseudofrankia inefficax]|uniref:ATP-dependent dethiobiotin synthetase BioD n=1 Tax=Pseudofrankia inefficax (strain DSM 45817 / CECT 9037 / DDB 130130 / EuI1c) TaxID=298654 RepID=E3IUZ9_PSEI1|nr:dethiobiotin synthase [Pseudofrankia inefficax]ADP78879.1 dethiobiotin synthase [Pseudofrankia inefficax]